MSNPPSASHKPIQRTALRAAAFILLATLLSGCALFGAGYAEYRQDVPSEYYLYLPSTYSVDRSWPLFVGIHAQDETGQDCLTAWRSYADEEGFVLLCPTLEIAAGSEAYIQNETTLAGVLGAVYSEYNLDAKFFLVGFSEGADFSLRYGSRYPQALTGVAANSSGSFPDPQSISVNLPILLTIGDQDVERLELTRSYAVVLGEWDHTARLVELKGVDHRLSGDAIRLSVEFFRQVTR